MLWQQRESMLVNVIASESWESLCSFDAGRASWSKREKKKKKKKKGRGVKWLVRLVSCEIEFMVFKTVNSIR